MDELDSDLFSDPEPLLSTLAGIFASDGKAREVAVLANANAVFKQVDYDNWNGGTYIYTLYLNVPNWLYAQISADLTDCETKILHKVQGLLRHQPENDLRQVAISPIVAVDAGWRDKARAWTIGEGVSNQGRVRSDNVASRTADGLLFRSEPEIFLYKALKSIGVSFAPLPVFVRGGEDYKRIEPDFVIIKDGIVMIVEVDGDTVHHETPAEAHARTTMLAHEGAHIERVKASECSSTETAAQCAKKLAQAIQKIKNSR